MNTLAVAHAPTQAAAKALRPEDRRQIHLSPRVLAMVEASASERDLLPSDLLGLSQRHDICRARYAVWAILSAEGKSLTQIGNMFGGRDHTTILNGLRRHDALQAGLGVAE